MSLVEPVNLVFEKKTCFVSNFFFPPFPVLLHQATDVLDFLILWKTAKQKSDEKNTHVFKQSS